jgi:hydrophobic/amphiphilic exporter-1 (mainly G- bacteria), HAE1 family
MRAVIEYAVQHRITVLMVTSAAVLFGLVSLGRMPVQLLPDVSYPTLTVQVQMPDSAPGEVESLLTRPLEETIGVVPGLRHMSSVSRAGVSEITLEFGWGTDMDFAALDVREKMDLVQLPDRAATPVVLRFDPSADPVVRIGLSGGDNLIALRYVAEEVLKKELESMDGVAAAKVQGGLKEEIHVDIDEGRLAQLGVEMTAVTQALRAENVNAAGGRLRDRDSQFLVRTLNQFTGPEDVAQTVVLREGERVVRLGDVATVQRAYKEREIVSRIDGKAAVEINILKEGDANLVEVADRVRQGLTRLTARLPESMEVVVLADQSVFVKAAVGQVQSNAMIGGVLAVIVLFVFLRDFRSTMIIALSIPASVVATFVLMYRQGVTLNVMSLGGLALGVGMLVDNSIVVLESIVRHRQLGGDSADSVVNGTNEVAQAVTASTLTTIAVFFPIFFVEGVARQIFQDQALTVTFALLVSLVVALTLTPMLSAVGRAGKANETDAPRNATPTSRARRAYARVLMAALSARPAVLVVSAALFAGAVLGMRGLGADLIPPLSDGQFRFAVQLPEGTPLEHTDEVVARIEASIGGVAGVDRVQSNIGVDATADAALRTPKENQAELNVRLDRGLRGEAQAAVLARIRERLADFPSVDARVLPATSFTFRTPVEVIVHGYDLEELRETAAALVERMQGVPGLRDVASSYVIGSPEVQIEFDRDKLKAAGLGLREASESLRTHILGDIATTYKERDRQIDIRVRGAQSQRVDFDALDGLTVGYYDGRAVPLASVATLRFSTGPGQVERVSQARAVRVTANLHGRDLGAVSGDLQSLLQEVPTPAGVTFELGGQSDEMRSSMRSLLFAVALAVFLVYLVMASQFESLLDPFLILFAVPLALIGVYAALTLTGTSVSVVVMIGGIMLAGIVVNNGIVLVDLIGQLRAKGATVRDAIVEAGATRLRPILMTTTTTVLGLSPMALGRGDGSEIGSPLAITVIGGLLVSTMLTLVVIPVLYSVFHREA